MRRKFFAVGYRKYRSFYWGIACRQFHYYFGFGLPGSVQKVNYCVRHSIAGVLYTAQTFQQCVEYINMSGYAFYQSIGGWAKLNELGRIDVTKG